MPAGFRYEPVLPLDQLILDFLPKEGSTFAGIYPIGENVRAMAAKIGKNQVRTSTFSARVRVMHRKGLVVPVNQPGGSLGRSWQITPAGEAQLVEWKGAASSEQQ